ncbi:type I-B CRISPR-associated protein Cas7/Csh2 [Halothermothrix orenii]|uniref:CRISPR-associated protein, Csh2 family n=1 Tax=Halothermothrix orenii (strain H 168 / OCM 544 / DSM 9562) TaxID=373903 RepID=B8CYA4_HALOH|nr:type I-B CRISPR-associated protein Cas7/Csh2 [Halothermothrix orenii]ACL70273.1 CRISPR-associated protein, Csh2 family [Halothermothrix orenii H 168]
MTEKQKVPNNSEILFLYDAKRSNPNGDMDNENKPRMDWDTGTNLVSDVRLKRYIRDYLQKVKGKNLFVSEEAEKAENRVHQILGRKPSSNKPVTDEELTKIAEECCDVIYFGAVLGTSGGNTHLTGPVQFNWGYSLNKVELQESKTITSSFSSGEGVGKDYRVKYSFIAFSGGINGLAAKDTKLTENDVKLLDEAIIKSIPLNRTRSKIGQTPRLYLRVEMNDNETALNDLREYISLDYNVREEDVRDINNIELVIDELLEYLSTIKSKIKKINYWKDNKLTVKDNGFEKLLNTFPVNELNY